MALWIADAAIIIVAYLFGSLPTGYLAGKWLKGIDIREHGSKSTGATNVLRVLGKGPALVVLVIDIAKGAGAIVFARYCLGWIFANRVLEQSDTHDFQQWEAWTVCLAGLAVLLGHSRSIWLNFSGGKSIATGLGLLLAMSWPVGLGAVSIFAIILAIFRIVSLSSMLAALAAAGLVFGLTHPLPYQLMVVAGAIYVIMRHRANIARLMAGTEPRLGQKSPFSEAGSK